MEQLKCLYPCGSCRMFLESYEDLMSHLYWRHGTESHACPTCPLRRWTFGAHQCHIIPPYRKRKRDDSDSNLDKKTKIVSLTPVYDLSILTLTNVYPEMWNTVKLPQYEDVSEYEGSEDEMPEIEGNYYQSPDGNQMQQNTVLPSKTTASPENLNSTNSDSDESELETERWGDELADSDVPQTVNYYQSTIVNSEQENTILPSKHSASPKNLESSKSDSDESESDDEMPDSDEPQKVIEERESQYCYCGKHIEGSDMIACDDEDCHFEWFHYQCAKVLVVPKGKWFCPDCRKR